MEQRANFPRVFKEQLKINRTFFKLATSIINSVEVIREKSRGYECQELVQNSFSLTAEFGQRMIRYLPPNRQALVNAALLRLAIQWVSFICDDCVATDRKTFRWAVVAMEYAMHMTRGRNVLTISEEDFDVLQEKIGKGMMLLISHFDIMGARSDLAARQERERLTTLHSQKLPLNSNTGKEYFESLDQSPFEHVRSEMIKHLQDIDLKREEYQSNNETVGKVLDATDSSHAMLTQLASSLSNIQIRWQQGRFLGGGSFGNVYIAINLDSGDLMAVKEIRMQDPQTMPTVAKNIKDEMTVLEMLDHPNVVSYYGIEVHRDKVYIFMEYCQEGSMANLLEYGPITDEAVIQVYTLEMLEGLAYLHSQGIAHRDIKPESKFFRYLSN